MKENDEKYKFDCQDWITKALIIYNLFDYKDER